MSQPPCRHKAMDLLARRPHFRRELERKLHQRGYDHEEVDTTLDRLEEQGLLDDAKTASGFVAHRLEREPYGRRRLLAELVRRGAGEDVARQAVDAQTDDDDRDLARAAAERHLRRGGTTPEKLARYLERRGFSRRAIVTVLQEAAAEETAAPEPWNEDIDPA